MKKPLIIGLLLVLILGGAFGVYKYFFEELVDYYTIIYIPPYEKEESNYDDLMCGVGLSSYSEPKITVERDWYPNKSDTDDKALSMAVSLVYRGFTYFLPFIIGAFVVAGHRIKIKREEKNNRC